MAMLATQDKAITEIKSFIPPLVPADNAAQYNSYLVFRFNKDDHKVGGFVETIIGDENNLEYKNHVKIEMVGVDNEFRGKNSFSKLELGKDIQGISGATISCRSTVEGVKKLTKRIYKMNQTGKL